MNRQQEYAALLAELEQTPAALQDTVRRAEERQVRERRRRWRVFGIPAGSFAACFLAFVLLVNLFPPFARACGDVPVLRELAKAVAWSPSLSAAVENDYVQPVEQTQTKNGITASVEYLIVDRKQLNIFYTLESQTYGQLEADGHIHMDEDGGYSSSSGSYGTPNGALRSIRVDFVGRDIPESLELELSVWAAAPETELPVQRVEDEVFEPLEDDVKELANFTFRLTFDPGYTAQGEVIPVNTAFTLAGQTLTLTEAELYPTHLRINLEDDAGNTAWLAELELYLENERGERFYASANGISATGDPDGEGMGSFWLDSPFFSQGEHLTLCITRAKWLDKDAPMTKADLRTGRAEHLPEGVRFLGAVERPGGWLVSFAAPMEKENHMYPIFSSGFYAEPNGVRQDIYQFSSTIGVEDPVTGERTEETTMFTEEFPLRGYHGDTVYLEPIFNRVTVFETPVGISIR